MRRVQSIHLSGEQVQVLKSLQVDGFYLHGYKRVAPCTSHNGLCLDIYVLDWWVLDKQVIDLCVDRHTNLSVEIINEKTRDSVWRRIQKRLSWPLKTFSLSFYRLRSFSLILSIFFFHFHRLFFPSLSRRLRSPLSLFPLSPFLSLSFRSLSSLNFSLISWQSLWN